MRTSLARDYEFYFGEKHLKYLLNKIMNPATQPKPGIQSQDFSSEASRSLLF
jgi:hypothetical protein